MGMGKFEYSGKIKSLEEKRDEKGKMVVVLQAEELAGLPEGTKSSPARFVVLENLMPKGIGFDSILKFGGQLVRTAREFRKSRGGDGVFWEWDLLVEKIEVVK